MWLVMELHVFLVHEYLSLEFLITLEKSLLVKKWVIISLHLLSSIMSLTTLKRPIKKEFTIVGDSLATDILGGNRAGIKTIWYNPKQLEVSGEAQPDVQIQDLLEIPSLVKNW